jgi:hypothetical protein
MGKTSDRAPGAHRPRARAFLTCLIAALFIRSCMLPAAWGRGGFLEGGTEFPGWWLLLLGWVPLYLYFPAWFANPMLVLVLRYSWAGRFGGAARLSWIAVALALVPLASFAASREELRRGYYFWLGSMIAAAIGSTALAVAHRRVQVAEVGPSRSDRITIRDRPPEN